MLMCNYHVRLKGLAQSAKILTRHADKKIAHPCMMQLATNIPALAGLLTKKSLQYIDRDVIVGRP